MKNSIKIVFLIMCLFTFVNFIGCSNQKQRQSNKADVPKYSQVTILEDNGEEFDALKIENKTLSSIGSVNKVEDMTYSIKNSNYIYSIKVSSGKNINGNIIDINAAGEKNQLKNFYAALDLRLNYNGDKLAFRTFKSDSLESAEGMKIYDIKNKKYLQLKSKVLVSGDIYQWLDNDKIIYYGSIEGKKNSQKIYLYDFKKNKESVYVDSINGYFMSVIPIKDKLLVLIRNGDKEELCYYDKKNNSIKIINDDISKIYSYIVNNKSREVFFIGNQSENINALYMFSYKDLSLKRITYDFPKQIDISSQIAMDNEGNVYFCGKSDTDNNTDVYMYDIKEGSINLVSEQSGKYSIYSNVDLQNAN